jgi:hypothetical protein
MDGLIRDMNQSLINLDNLQGINDIKKEGLGLYIERMREEIMNDRM